MEKEIISLFDNITPKGVYLMKYASPYFQSCIFEDPNNKLDNDTEVCYHAGLRRLVIRNDYEDENNVCIFFYQLWDEHMNTFYVIQNKAMVENEQVVAKMKWSLIEPDQCGYSNSSKILDEFMLLLILIIYNFSIYVLFF